ncbi:MAG: hypothetical protein K2H52_06385 [Lachnospiraceae bacterium]|nr:hypothetical protein [Lachnospiraceae bacterium]MDE6184853.1 hypothetical protein [Lachnospiraceae bacterium]
MSLWGQCTEQGQERYRKGILCESKIKGEPLFLLKGTGGNHVMASLAFVESAYRREARDMGIEEFVVR